MVTEHHHSAGWLMTLFPLFVLNFSHHTHEILSECLTRKCWGFTLHDTGTMYTYGYKFAQCIRTQKPQPQPFRSLFFLSHTHIRARARTHEVKAKLMLLAVVLGITNLAKLLLGEFEILYVFHFILEWYIKYTTIFVTFNVLYM